MRRIIKSMITITAFVVCVMTLSIIASAEKYKDFIYKIEDNGVIITAYTGDDSFVYIPDQIDGRDVVAIGRNAFYYQGDDYEPNYSYIGEVSVKENTLKKNCPKIKNIRLPNMLREIGKCAFRDCSSLEKLILPNSLVEIEDIVYDFGNIVYGCTNLETIVMGDNIYKVGGSSFSEYISGFYRLTKLRKISLNATYYMMTNSLDETSALRDVYFRGSTGAKGPFSFDKDCSFHFATKEDMENESDSGSNVDYISLSKSHYKVTYNANGGKIPIIKGEAYYSPLDDLSCDWEITGYKSKTSIWTLRGQQVSEEIRPIKEDCTFVGWYDNKECEGEPWNFVLDTVSKNMTLYAKWKPKEFKVTFNTNGGKCNTKTALYSFGRSMKSLPVPTKKGYDFAGWYTRKNANGDRFNEKTKMPKNDITLYAAWIKEGTKIKVSLDPNGGKCTKKSVTYRFNQKMKTLPTPSYKGKKFLGWNTQKNGKGTYYTKDMRIDVPRLKLYAIWGEIE